jgi:hypothetical protein
VNFSGVPMPMVGSTPQNVCALAVVAPNSSMPTAKARLSAIRLIFSLTQWFSLWG